MKIVIIGNEPKNSMQAAIEGYTLFPDDMWAQLAVTWGIPVNMKQIDQLSLDLTRLYFKSKEQKHNLIYQHADSNY